MPVISFHPISFYLSATNCWNKGKKNLRFSILQDSYRLGQRGVLKTWPVATLHRLTAFPRKEIQLQLDNIWSFCRAQYTLQALKWLKVLVNHSSVQSLSHVRLFATAWTAARQASLSITNSQSPPKPMSIESVMPSNHLILVVPFSSCPQSFPESGSFQMSQLFTSSGQSIRVRASTSVLPMNIQDWCPLGWTGWISLQSKGLSTPVFSNTTVQKHQFFGVQLSL